MRWVFGLVANLGHFQVHQKIAKCISGALGNLFGAIGRQNGAVGK